VDMFTLFKRLLMKEQLSIQKVKRKKYFLHLACGNNHDGIFLILCMVLNAWYTIYFFLCFINFINL
jgi:hypothetical protein